LPTIDDWQEVESLEDLTSTIELYNTLIGRGRFDVAAELFNERLADALLYRLAASRQIIELLEMLFPDGLDQLPRLSFPSAQSYILNNLATGVSTSGQMRQAAALYRRSLDIKEKMSDQLKVCVSLLNLSDALRFSGALYDSEVAARKTLLIAQQAGRLEYQVLTDNGRRK
jgi:hypothetical protein